MNVCQFAGLVILTAAFVIDLPAHADDRYESSDPIAAIQGQPIFLGELNLILVGQLGLEKLDEVKLDVQRAAAVILVRRHLAMNALQARGGEALQAIIDRQVADFAAELERRGGDLATHAKQRGADEASLRADLAWRIAWKEYLKSQLTDTNMRRFFKSRPQQYTGGQWEVSQIFLEAAPGDATTAEIASGRLNELLATLETSEELASTFADAARQHSEAGSADEGGKIGWVEAVGDLPGPVMRIVQETKPGELGGPVRSHTGWHLILVHAFEPKAMEFEQLADLARLRRDAADMLFENLLKSQQGTPVTWLIDELRPPAEVSLIPSE